MSQLAHLQDVFQDYLMHDTQGIQQHVLDTENVAVETRLNIYRYAYLSRLLDALQSNYPILCAYLGDEFFQQLGQDYIEKHPSSFRSIRWFGDQLAVFLLSYTPFADYPHLSELAQVEWVMTLVFDAADDTVLTTQALETIPPTSWADMRILTHPSLHLLPLSWNVMDIWQAISNELDPPEPVEDARVSWVFWRNGLMNQFCALSKEEACAIATLMNTPTLSAISEALNAYMDEESASTHAVSYFRGWVSAGIIAGVEI